MRLMKSGFKNQDQLSLQNTNPSRFPDQFPHSIHIALSMDLCRKAVQMEKTIKQKAEQAIKLEAKKARPAPPVHGQRLFFEAKLYWMNQYGSKRSGEVQLLLYSGCTGPLLSRDFGHMNKLLKVSRARPIVVSRMPMGTGPRAVTEAGRRAVTNKATSRGRRVSASGLSGVPR